MQAGRKSGKAAVQVKGVAGGPLSAGADAVRIGAGGPV
jgi:hypothetical protein